MANHTLRGKNVGITGAANGPGAAPAGPREPASVARAAKPAPPPPAAGGAAAIGAPPGATPWP